MRKLLLVIAILATGHSLLAVQTASWEINDSKEWRKGEMEGAVISPDGFLTTGATATKIALVSTPVTDEDTGLWCNVRIKDEVYFGSAKGIVYRLTADNKLEEVFKTGEWLITSMVNYKSNIFAATIPDGKIFKIDIAKDAIGKGSLFATLPQSGKYIWQLCFDADNTLYAATGPEGKIYKIDSTGKSDIFYDTKKKNVLSLIFSAGGGSAPGGDGKGYFYAGTADPGIVYRISLKGRPEIVADFGDLEIKSLLYHKEELFIGANQGVKVAPQEFLSLIKTAAKKMEQPPALGGTQKPTTPDNQQPIPLQKEPVPPKEQSPDKKPLSDDEDDEEPQPPPPGAGDEHKATAPGETISAPPPPEKPRPPVHSIIYKLSNGLIREIITINDCYITEMKMSSAAGGTLIVGTDNSGRVYQILQDGKFSIPYDLDAEQVLTLVMKDDDLYCVGTGKKAAVYLMQKDLVRASCFTSDAWDARFPARWGNFSFKGQGTITLQTQSGNTAKPDETWSDWSEKITVKPDGSAKPTTPTGRYFRVKLLWEDKNTIIQQIHQNYLIHNQQPKISELKVPLPPLSATGIPPRAIAKKIIYQAKDPDCDTLSYRIYYRNENQKVWLLLNQDQPGGLITATEYNWNTESLPDGNYFIRVEVTDEKVNTSGTELKDEKTSDAIIVDNTRPLIKDLKITGKLECSGKVEDNLSQIARIEYSIDGGKWELTFPLDGILDSKVEDFRFILPAIVSSGAHNISIRVFDLFGNMGLEQIEFEGK